MDVNNTPGFSGNITIPSFTTAGVVHNDSGGNLTSSLIVNADVDSAAAIADSKLATISTAGKVSNSATTATNSNTASTIVIRHTDKSITIGAGNFTADNATTMLAPQCLVRGETDNAKQLGFGYNTTSNHGYIQSVHNLVAYTPLSLQPLGGTTVIGATAGPTGLTAGLHVISSSPATNNYGGRVTIGGLGSGDLLMSIGLYNDGGVKKIMFGGHNNSVSAWADSYWQPAANAFINDTSGVTTVGSGTAGSSKFNVVGTSNLGGNVTVGSSGGLSAGQLRYSSNIFSINNGGNDKVLNNPINFINSTSGTAYQLTVITQEIVISRVSGSFALSSSTTDYGFTAASVSSQNPLEVTVNYAAALLAAPLFGTIHSLFVTNTAICYDARFKNLIGTGSSNVVKLYLAGAAINNSTFTDGDTFRLTVFIAL